MKKIKNNKNTSSYDDKIFSQVSIKFNFFVFVVLVISYTSLPMHRILTPNFRLNLKKESMNLHKKN